MKWKDVVGFFNAGTSPARELVAETGAPQKRVKRSGADSELIAITLPAPDWKNVLSVLEMFGGSWSSAGSRLDPKAREYLGAIRFLMEDQLQKGFGDSRSVEFDRKGWRNIMATVDLSLLDDSKEETKSVARLIVQIHEGVR